MGFESEQNKSDKNSPFKHIQKVLANLLFLSPIKLISLNIVKVLILLSLKEKSSKFFKESLYKNFNLASSNTLINKSIIPSKGKFSKI